MAELTFRCPYTNKIISSGIEMEEDSATALRAQTVRVLCPHCHFDHFGVVADGTLRPRAAA